MVGAGKYLKEKSKNVVRVGVARLPNNPVPGVRTPNLLREITFNWKQTTDYVEEVGTKESFEKSMDLCRAGIVAGPSSGFALQGLLQFFKKQKDKGKLDDFKSKNGEIIAVFICPDSPFPYLDEYFQYLDASHFPKIEHEELLINKPNKENSKKEKSVPLAGFDIDPVKAYELAYKITPKEAWTRLEEGGDIPLREKVSIVDVRPYSEFIHFHLPGSERLDSHIIAENFSRLSKKWKGGTVLLLCPMGIRTRAIAEFLQNKGLRAYSIKGGATEWSALNLPRWRPNICNVNDRNS